MAETSNTSQIASKLTSELFRLFNWTQVGPKDANWSCVKPEHGKNTHPSDCVWWYNEPYGGKRIYINTDLKSYAAGSITKGNVTSAIHSLGLAVDCAPVSSEWKRLYAPEMDIDFDVVGLLFVYNHDGSYNKDFHDLYKQVNQGALDLRGKSQIYVVGPEDIRCLDSMYNDLCREATLPGNENLFERVRVFYPELRRQKVHHSREQKLSLSIMSMTSPINYFHLPNSEGPNGDIIYVYYRGSCDSREEFMHLIDSIYAYQQVDTSDKIVIRLLSATSEEAEVNFYNATKDYERKMKTGASIEKFECRRVTRVTTNYSSLQIGMQRDEQ